MFRTDRSYVRPFPPRSLSLRKVTRKLRQCTEVCSCFAINQRYIIGRIPRTCCRCMLVTMEWSEAMRKPNPPYCVDSAPIVRLASPCLLFECPTPVCLRRTCGRLAEASPVRCCLISSYTSDAHTFFHSLRQRDTTDRSVSFLDVLTGGVLLEKLLIE